MNLVTLDRTHKDPDTNVNFTASSKLAALLKALADSRYQRTIRRRLEVYCSPATRKEA